jgi:hypothetical protein
MRRDARCHVGRGTLKEDAVWDFWAGGVERVWGLQAEFRDG